MENKKTKLTISEAPKSFKDFSSPKPQGKKLSSSNRGFSRPTGKDTFKNQLDLVLDLQDLILEKP